MYQKRRWAWRGEEGQKDPLQGHLFGLCSWLRLGREQSKQASLGQSWKPSCVPCLRPARQRGGPLCTARGGRAAGEGSAKAGGVTQVSN